MTRDMSIVQNRVSMNEDGIVRMDERVRTLLGWLIGGERATSAYNGYGLV
jgi:hypothetical protein